MDNYFHDVITYNSRQIAKTFGVPKSTLNESKGKMKQYTVQTHLLDRYSKNEEIPEKVVEELVKEGCPESWFSPVEEGFKEGDWVVTKSEILFKITHIDDETYGGYGFDIIDGRCWFNEDYNVSLLRHIERKATEKEVSNALIAEAKRRGFDGYKGKIIDTYGDEYEAEFLPHKEKYDAKNDTLWMECGDVYRKGKWAEIIDEPIRINGNEVFFDDNANYFKVGCRDIYKKDFRSFSKLVISNGLKVSYKGEDITKQIKQIADKL